MSGFEGTPPNPYEVAMYPVGYVEQLLAWHHGVRYWEDKDKREAGVFL